MKDYANSFKNLRNTEKNQISSLMNACSTLTSRISAIRKDIRQLAKYSNNGIISEAEGKRRIMPLLKEINKKTTLIKNISRKRARIIKRVKTVEKNRIIRMAQKFR